MGVNARQTLLSNESRMTETVQVNNHHFYRQICTAISGCKAAMQVQHKFKFDGINFGNLVEPSFLANHAICHSLEFN
jgi:hypothetical protein